MSANDISQLMFAGGIFINAIISGLTYIRTARSAKTIQMLEMNTNSIKDALVKVTAESEYAKGVLQGAIDEKATEQKRKQ